MGSWGYDSCSSDSVWDLLLGGDIQNMTKEEADASLNYAWSEKNKEDRLGVVIWVLRQGFQVSQVRLKAALGYANTELHSDKLEDWVDGEERRKALVIEMNEIRAAQENDGYGTKKRTKGLIEQTEEPSGAKITVSTTNDMWLLRLHNREEFEDMRVSFDYRKLKAYVRGLVKGKVVFHKRGNLFFAHKKTNSGPTEIGIIAKVEVI